MTKNRGAGKKNEMKDKLEDDLDGLFRLPVGEFTAARNALAVQLKKSGRRYESERVKALAKPSITAWAVNQLYWQHREAFDRLIASGQRFRKAQTAGRAAKLADIREALDDRREVLLHLSDLATVLLRDAGSGSTPETIHRISTTLEALSAYGSSSDDLRPGRLSRDVDPPGFDSLAALIPGSGMTKMTKEPVRATSSQKSDRLPSSGRKEDSRNETSEFKQKRKAKIAAAKVSVQEAKSTLVEARARAQSLEAAQKKANADVKKTGTDRRLAEERFERARLASEAAIRHARSIAVEAEGAAKAVEEAKRTIERAEKNLETL
jgi:hypothetical protein